MTNNAGSYVWSPAARLPTTPRSAARWHGAAVLSREWAQAVAELRAGGIDPGELVEVTCHVAADPDLPVDVREVFAERAHALATALGGPFTLIAVRATAVYSAFLGQHRDPAVLWQPLIARCETAGIDRLDAGTRLAYAVALHHQGRCQRALDHISQAWSSAVNTPLEQAPPIVMARRTYRAMIAACRLTSADGSGTLAPTSSAAGRSPLSAGALIAAPAAHRTVCGYLARTCREVAR